MIELYHNDMSTCSQKVRFALAEKGLEWTNRYLNLRGRDHQKAEYLKLNPNAVVPTLVDNGAVIIESTIINEYLDDAYPEPRLRPADARARARMRLWTKQLDEGAHAATGVLSTGIAFRYQKLALGPEALEALIENVPDPVKRERTRQDIMKGVDTNHFADAVKRFDGLLGDFEVALSDGPWLAGGEFSLADIAYAPYMIRLEHLQLEMLWENRSRTAGWYTRLRERPAFQTSITAWLSDSYLTLMEEKGREVQNKIRAIVTS
jgi:glutathione S-transferase